MSKRLVIAFMLSAAVFTLRAADDNLPSTVYKSAAELMATLAKNAQGKSGQATSPIVNEDHYRINIVRRDSAGVAMAHATGPAKGSELHYIIDGAATVVTGGALGRGAIEGGESRRVSKGDVIFIPAGTPHWYKNVEGSVTYLEVRFDVELKK
jgi:mannose-6-phosphate isomerase-like protein (cupin superfamily)